MSSKLESLIFKVNDDLFNKISKKFEAVDKRFESIDSELKEHRRLLNNHTGALLNIESRLDIYNDMYQNSKFKIKELDTRVIALENS